MSICVKVSRVLVIKMTWYCLVRYVKPYRMVSSQKLTRSELPDYKSVSEICTAQSGRYLHRWKHLCRLSCCYKEAKNSSMVMLDLWTNISMSQPKKRINCRINDLDASHINCIFSLLVQIFTLFWSWLKFDQ